MRNFYNQIKGLKVTELPKVIKPMLTRDYVKKAVDRGMITYYDKYIDTNSIAPLYHICFGGMALSYLIALPEERRHLAHKEQHGAAH